MNNASLLDDAQAYRIGIEQAVRCATIHLQHNQPAQALVELQQALRDLGRLKRTLIRLRYPELPAEVQRLLEE